MVQLADNIISSLLFNVGYKGVDCQERIQQCSEGVCYNGSCEPDPSTNSYKCKCKPGYIGSHCSVYNECDDSKCNYQGTCEPTHDEHELFFIHKCNCRDGFSGTDCTTKVNLFLYSYFYSSFKDLLY